VRTLVLAVVALALAVPAFAAGPRPRSVTYLGARYISPTDDLDRGHDWGWGIVGGGQNRAGQYTSLLMEGGWYRIKGTKGDVEALSVPDKSMFGVLLGAAVSFQALDIGVKGGYFFGDHDEWDVMPFAQIMVKRFALGGEYKALGDARWIAGYVNLLF
jgi:hypothetical protein